jgi:hypothetical protein
LKDKAMVKFALGFIFIIPEQDSEKTWVEISLIDEIKKKEETLP